RGGPEAFERDVRPPEVAGDVIDDVAQPSAGDEPHVTQVQLERLATEHDRLAEVARREPALEVGGVGRQQDAWRGAVSEQLLAGLAPRGRVEALARVDV